MLNILTTAFSMIGDLKFNPKALLDMLPYIGEGMLCIFIVIGIIILITILLNKITSKDK